MINNELIIQSHQQGITLANPDSSWPPSHQRASVGHILSLPLNMYFMDHNSVMQRMNDATAETNGYLSPQDAIGKSIRNVASRESARLILENDRAIIRSRNFQVLPEYLTRLDDVELTALSIKFPWYQGDAVVGILGCSILLDEDGAPSLTQALTMLIQAGLLSPAIKTTVTSGKRCPQFAGVIFDQRDTDILYLLVRGKTAKNIARQLQLSHRTVEHRLEVIKHKLVVSSKSELIEKIIDQFIVNPAAEGS
jgi:DNA-binding CsgD family transcriptional regulator